MLDSRSSTGQGLNQINLRLDCRARPVAAPVIEAASLSATSPTRPEPVRCATSPSNTGSHLQRRDSETRPSLSTSNSTSSLYTLSSAAIATSTSANSSSSPRVVQSPPGSPRPSSVHVDAGSPKIRSPLRNSVTFAEGPVGLHFYDADSTSSSSTQPSHSRFPSVDMALTGDKRTRGYNPANSVSTTTCSTTNPNTNSESSPLSRWFSRGNTPSDPTTPSSMASTPPSRARSASTTPKMGSPASRFTLFSTSSAKDMSSSPVSVPQNDRLMNLDIESALFPNGPPSDGSPFSPAAYKNLEMNALGLLHKFQSAYQQRTIQYEELRAEREAQEEEKEEVETRVAHLKMQLEDMAQKAAEREEIMASLLQELASEKRARTEDRNSRDRCFPSSETSTVSEDLGVDEDRQRKLNWRKSTATSKSDLSLDTDEDSIDEASIFSRSRSPTIATSMTELSPVSTPTPPQKPIILEPPRSSRPGTTQLSTFQKLFKGYSSEAPKDDGLSANGNGCRNCQGQDSSVAWDTVSLLKDENKGLKVRVEELESAVESALDAVNGIAL